MNVQIGIIATGNSHQRLANERPKSVTNLSVIVNQKEFVDARIVHTIFVSNYRKIRMHSMRNGEFVNEEDQHALHLKKIVEACQRTRDVVVQIRLVPMFDKLLKHTRHRQFFDHDPRYLSLGTLLPIATQLDRQWSLPEKILADFNSRNIPAPEEFIVEEVCPNPGCGERFAYSIKNTEAAGKCPFCDLKSRFEKAFKTQA